MQKLYLVPIELWIDPVEGGEATRGPKYLDWYDGSHTGILTPWSMMDYGFVPYGLVLCKNITQVDHDALVLNADVYDFPDNLDVPVADPNIDVFFEGINIPTDWLTPSTDYRELLRQLAGMFLYNQRYGNISGGQSIFDVANLDTRLRQMTAQEQVWFRQTADEFVPGSGDTINDNQRLRQLVKQAATIWDGQPFFLGGLEF